MPKWYIARDVTEKKEFKDKEEALKWMLLVQAATSGEVLLEAKKGVWVVYW